MIWKRIVASALAVCVTFAATPLANQYHANNTSVVYAAEAQSGTCGENAFWKLSEDGTLTISGSGEMTDWEHTSYIPWCSFRNTIKKVIVESGITGIGWGTFYKCENLTSVELPDSVTIIPEYAFSGCENLVSIRVPKNLKRIDANAFLSCKKMEVFSFPDTVNYIGEYAFQDCESLVSIHIPASVTALSKAAFSHCYSVETIDFSSNLKSIGYGTFYSLTSLKSIQLPSSLQTVGDVAFSRCSALEKVSLPDSITSVGYNAFASCTALNSVSFSVSLNKISRATFYNCPNLRYIEIPDNITSIAEGAFVDCSNLAEIAICNASCTIADNEEVFPVDTIIKGQKDSTAQAYAEKFNRQFVLLENNNLYDFNKERENIIALQSFLLIRPYYGNEKVIDVNEDNRVDVIDLCLAKRAFMNAVNEIYLELDSDDNGWPDCLENDDHTTDTDGDGLSDYDELMYTNTSPVLPDSDNNGVSDSFEDPDGDGISIVILLKK